MSSADNLGKQTGPRSGPTKRQHSIRSELSDTLMVLLKDLEKK